MTRLHLIRWLSPLALALPLAVIAQQGNATKPGSAGSGMGQAATPAQPAPDPYSKAGTGEPGPAFNHADTNRDGRLSKDEALSSGIDGARFNALDRNHDSYVSLDEYPGTKPR